ncbi:MAG TPA: isoprenylcysteine carboxylmethyltransferase family protein [Pseudolabrys sp.]|jgi:protein-S-isoprenylcysteine O-methyltransferase Ste14
MRRLLGSAGVYVTEDNDVKANTLGHHASVRSALFVLAMAAMLFVPAGSLDFWQGWLYALVFVAATTAISIYFLKHDPKLVERRMRAGPLAEDRLSQKIIMAITLFGFVLALVLPGLDHRWHWSAVPAWLVLVANAGVALTFVIFFIVLKQNRYAASTIRVEADQPVISTGVYSIVRHPMYSGALLLLVFTPLALGSFWAMLLIVPLVPVLIWRLLDEEYFLKQNLPGYVDYCRTIRFRLIPRIW